MQRSTMMRKVIPIILFNLASAFLFAQQRDTSFDNYWAKFRKAAVAKDYTSIESMTRFPLLVKGTNDFDKVKKFTKNRFPYIFEHYLKQENAAVTRNALQDIIETESIPVSMNNSNKLTYIRFSDMKFRKRKGRWELYLIYIETKYQEANNIR